MKLHDLLVGLNQFTVVIAVLAGLIGAWLYPKLTPGQRRLAWLAGFDAVLELVTDIMLLTGHQNLFLYPVVLLGEIVLLGLLYQQVLQSAVSTRVIPWLTGVAAAYVAGETIVKWGSLHQYTGSQVVSHLLALVLAGLFFQKLLNELQIEKLSTEPFFWVSAALTVHSLGDLFIALFSNYLQAHYSLTLQRIVLIGVRNSLNVCLYATYCLALWMRPPRLSS